METPAASAPREQLSPRKWTWSIFPLDLDAAAGVDRHHATLLEGISTSVSGPSVPDVPCPPCSRCGTQSARAPAPGTAATAAHSW